MNLPTYETFANNFFTYSRTRQTWALFVPRGTFYDFSPFPFIAVRHRSWVVDLGLLVRPSSVTAAATATAVWCIGPKEVFGAEISSCDAREPRSRIEYLGLNSGGCISDYSGPHWRKHHRGISGLMYGSRCQFITTCSCSQCCLRSLKWTPNAALYHNQRFKYGITFLPSSPTLPRVLCNKNVKRVNLCYVNVQFKNKNTN